MCGSDKYPPLLFLSCTDLLPALLRRKQLQPRKSGNVLNAAARKAAKEWGDAQWSQAVPTLGGCDDDVRSRFAGELLLAAQQGLV